MKLVATAVKIVFLLVAWGFWLVLGTIFWIALVARALAVFAGVFMYAMFTTQDAPPVSRELDDLSDLWFRGFRNAYNSLFGVPGSRRPVEVRNGRLVLECAWACAIWYLAFLSWSGQLLPAFGHFGGEIGHFFGAGISEFSSSVSSAGPGWRAGIDAFVAVLFLVIGFAGGVNAEESTKESKTRDKAAT